MSTGKYSPTVLASYRLNQNWWEEHCNDPSIDLFDREGYDNYGYNLHGKDREGYSEDDYLLCGEWVDDEYRYPLYESIAEKWSKIKI